VKAAAVQGKKRLAEVAQMFDAQRQMVSNA
jgi:hypothetical protein